MGNLHKLVFAACLLMPGLGAMAQGTTCATATPIADGACRNGENMPGSFSGGFAGCNGGSTPVHFYSFTAPLNGDCVQFNITNPSVGGTWECMIYTAGCASYVSGSGGCVENVVAGMPFAISGQDPSGNNILTPGSSYVLILSANNPTTYNLCFTSPSAPAPSNECGGAMTLMSTLPPGTTYYNGGDCQFSGSFDDATTTDPGSAALLCAGSLENTQWISFTSASAANVVVTGGGISCTGGGCGFQFGIFSAGVGGNCCGGLTHLGCYGNKVCSGGQSTAGPTNPIGRITWSGTSTTGFTATITGVSAGEVFCFIMDGNADADCQFNLSATNILPVVLSNFSGYDTEEGIGLAWSTQMEINASHFEVFRSIDGLVFESLGTVQAKAREGSGADYNFIDRATLTGERFYYLKLVDRDGTFEMSETIQLDKLGESMSLSILGDEVHVLLSPLLANANGVTITVTDMTGRLAGRYVVPLGQQEFSADLSGLGAGTYMATLSSPGRNEYKKFVLR